MKINIRILHDRIKNKWKTESQYQVHADVFLVKIGKSKHHHWILHIWISLGTKFHLKLGILIFGTKFAQKGYFWSKTEKVNTTIEFYIFEKGTRFQLKLTIWILGPNLPKKGVSVGKRKKWTLLFKSTYLN